MSQTVWLSFKEQRTEHVRNPVNAPMTGIGNVIIGRIGTTEIVTGTGIGREKETGVGIATEHVIVIESEVGIVAVTMSVIDTENVIDKCPVPDNIFCAISHFLRNGWFQIPYFIVPQKKKFHALLKLAQKMLSGTEHLIRLPPLSYLKFVPVFWWERSFIPWNLPHRLRHNLKPKVLISFNRSRSVRVNGLVVNLWFIIVYYKYHLYRKLKKFYILILILENDLTFFI